MTAERLKEFVRMFRAMTEVLVETLEKEIQEEPKEFQVAHTDKGVLFTFPKPLSSYDS